MPNSIPKIAVVGGGVAGLATAWLMAELGREAGRRAEITVFEALPEPGGATRTDIMEGFTCEWGPNGFLDNEPATLDLVARLGLTDRLVKADESAGRRFIYWGGKMRELPTKPPAFLVSDILPWPAKLRVAGEILVPAKRNGAEETVYSFGRRRLGRGFADLLLDPMVSGIFAGDTRELSLEAVFPKMVAMEREYGGLFRALIAKSREAKRTGRKMGGPSGANAVLHTFREGMGELTAALASRLAGALRLASPVQALEVRDGGFLLRLENETVPADAVVLACPSWAAAEIIAGLDPDAAQAAGRIWHAPVDVVCHGHPAPNLGHDLHGFGVLVPRSEGLRALGSLWSDSIFPGQAPAGMKLLRTILGGAHDPAIAELSDAELERTAHRNHEQMFGVRAEPAFRRVFRHPRGIAQYTLGHLGRVAQTERLERELPGLYFTGASYRGVSVNGCAKDAFRVARAFWDQWGARS